MPIQGGPFFLSMFSIENESDGIFKKPHLDINSQIRLLEERGLILSEEDREVLKNFLKYNSFSRITPYMRKFQYRSDKNHRFKEGTRLSDILDVYNFDRKLKLIVFEAIEQIEVSWRMQFSYGFSILENMQEVNEVGIRTWWYEDSTFFKNVTNHAKNLEKIDLYITKSIKSDPLIQNYNNKYNHPVRPPSWMVFELMSIGSLVMFFKNIISDLQPKRNIVHHYGLSLAGDFDNWSHCVSYIRNICAHHARLWDSIMYVKLKPPTSPMFAWPSMAHLTKENGELEQRFYPILCAIIYFVERTTPGTLFKSRIRNLIEDSGEKYKLQIGFPENWLHEDFWRV